MAHSAHYYNKYHNYMKVGDSDANLVHPGFLYFIWCNYWLYHGRFEGSRHGSCPSCRLSRCRIINTASNVTGSFRLSGWIGIWVDCGCPNYLYRFPNNKCHKFCQSLYCVFIRLCRSDDYLSKTRSFWLVFSNGTGAPIQFSGFQDSRHECYY